MRRPIAVLAAAYAAGIFIQRYYPLLPQKALFTAALFAFAATLACAALRRAEAGGAAAVLLAAILGAMGYAPFQDLPASVKQLGSRFNMPVAVEGAVQAVERLPGGALRLTIFYDSIETPGEQFSCSGLMQLTIKKPCRAYLYGQRLRFSCRLRRPRNFNNPGGFDYRRFLEHRTIYFTAFSGDDRSVLVLRDSGGAALRRALERYRDRVRGLICERLAPPQREIVLALTLGEKHSLDPEVRKSFARMGASHLLAISGLHIGIVAGLAFGLACLVLRIRPRILLYAELWKTAALCTLLPVAAYCCIAGLQIPTLRAGIMICACVACLLLNRPQDVMSALGLACFAMLVWKPPSLFEISFQLSFAAVFFLILYAPLAGRLSAAIEGLDKRRSRSPALWLFRVLFGILSASVIASAATAPLTARYFQQFALAGIPANCLLVPAIGFGAVPCALAASLIMPVSQTLSALLLDASGMVIGQALLWIDFWSEALITARPIRVPGSAAIAAWYALLLIPCCLNKKRALAALLLCPAITLALFCRKDERSEALLRVTFLDVGHGDAAVIEFASGRAMLIDGGGLRSDSFDTGGRIVVPALRAMGIREVAWLVITHPHHDHIAGMGAVLKAFHPQELWVTRTDYADPIFRSILNRASSMGVCVQTLSSGTTERSIEGARIEILGPDSLQAEAASSYQELNDSSLVLKISCGRHAFLFAGDIGAVRELQLAGQSAVLGAQVLKVPHHGKRGSSTDSFLDAVHPGYAVFSCRPAAGQDLPADVLERYHQRGARVLRTDLHGAIQITSDGSRLDVRSFLPHERFMPLHQGDQARAHPATPRIN